MAVRAGADHGEVGVCEEVGDLGALVWVFGSQPFGLGSR